LASGARQANLIADGVYRCGTELVNWYVVEDGGRLTIVDAGAPKYWPQLDQALSELGKTRDDVAALVLTHGHSDHVGFAEQLRAESGTPVWAPEGDEEMVRTGKVGKTDGSMLPYLRHPFAWKMVSHLARNGGAKIPPVKEFSTYADGQTLDVPGRPVATRVPGHTEGHSVLKFGDVVFVGDVLCTLNPLTGRRGPQIAPKAFNKDSRQALESLDRVPEASMLAVGHGDPWTEGIAAAVERARATGVT
jgi:glyoxylase-like metal-dependent hydrolase (beta-lactamase superfamily II)